MRAVHQRRQERDQVDAAVMPDLRRQCRAPPAPRARLQPGKFHAHAGDAQDGGAVVADQPAREADQDRREGRQPRPLRYLPDGRGRGAATDVRRHPVADRPAAGTARASMSGAEAENDRRQRESCVLIKAKPPNLTLAGWEHIASAADNVRLPTRNALRRGLNGQTKYAPFLTYAYGESGLNAFLLHSLFQCSGRFDASRS